MERYRLPETARNTTHGCKIILGSTKTFQILFNLTVLLPTAQFSLALAQILLILI